MSAESPKSITINSDFIELCQVLKFQGLVGSGGEGKIVIAGGQVSVNGNIETRKRAKIRSGDTFKFQGDTYVIAGPNA
jgi:ribosome-associated protein|tara:strand:+ start:4305 stop:4538 length:234 start_codon:yes stop_codon:yes gene_type:complete